MIKRILLVIMLSATCAFALSETLRVGGVTNASNYNSSSSSDFAPSLGLEVGQSLGIIDVGVGIAYNGSTGDNHFSTLPAYLLAKFNLFPAFVKPYIVAKVGYNLYTDSDLSTSNPKGKAYYGAGIGMDILAFQAELLYSSTQISGDNRGGDNLNQIGIYLGYDLN